MSLGHACGIEAAAIDIVLRLNANLAGPGSIVAPQPHPGAIFPATLTPLEA